MTTVPASTRDLYFVSSDSGLTWRTITFRDLADRMAARGLWNEANENRLFDGHPIDGGGGIQYKCEEVPAGKGTNGHQ